ncbi:uncharacterized protein LOC142635293 [Castanea sativa]|uniref:uncharacterized protein LOC142635293 n=1 Tax=Castanea sativa TaxID=21020 RepID=UPI003F654432
MSRCKGVLSVVLVKNSEGDAQLGKKPKLIQGPVEFRDEDLEGTAQPHNDALVVTGRISGFVVKKVLVDQESEAKVMYPDLYMGLGLKLENLSKYDTPLVGFDGQMVIPEGQISLLVNIEGKEVMVNFIVVNSFSPHTTILDRPWIHAMGAVSSTLHVKVKFHTKQGVSVIRGDQQVARQCLVAVVNWEIKKKKSIE